MQRPAWKSEERGEIERPGVELRGGRWDRTAACQAVVRSGIEPPHVKQWWAVRSHRARRVQRGAVRSNGQALTSEEGGGIEPPGIEQSLAVRSNRCASRSEGRGGMQRPAWKSEERGEIERPGVELRGGRWDRTAACQAVGSGIEPPHVKQWWAVRSHRARRVQRGAVRSNGQALISEESGGIEPPGIEQSLAVRSNRCASRSEGRGGMQRPAWRSEGRGGIDPPGIEQLLAVRWNRQM
ncbi:hypothetical protein B0H14DRAFT_123428 [Mycena olivaceomarginata]|nr:hypothetical protein B0H14DRAFT_123428 [Mycena olivaceomarginata]